MGLLASRVPSKNQTTRDDADKCESVYDSTEQLEEGDVEHGHEHVNSIKLGEGPLHKE